jgi:hypothetical protein
VLDIRARDSAGRWLNIEMQVSIFAGLLQRLVYYACTMYVDQLKSGGSYADLGVGDLDLPARQDPVLRRHDRSPPIPAGGPGARHGDF